jgi:hypothetical protein
LGGGRFLVLPTVSDLDPHVGEGQEAFAARVVVLDDGFTDHLADFSQTFVSGFAGRHGEFGRYGPDQPSPQADVPYGGAL